MFHTKVIRTTPYPVLKMVTSTCGVTVASHRYCVCMNLHVEVVDGWSHHDDQEYIILISI